MSVSVAYLVGLLTLPAVFVVGWLIAAYFDGLRRKRRLVKHGTCGLWHTYRPVIPWWLMKLTAVPVTEWRCARGAQVPVDYMSHGIGWSNDPEETRE